MFTTVGKRAIPALVALLLLLATWTSTMDAPAMEQIDAGMKRALVSYAGARALNGAISLFQGTEVTVGVLAEVTVSVGEILDPVNDLVESFSNLMLIASVAFGIQKVLLEIGEFEYVKILLTAVLFAWGVTRAISGSAPRWLDTALLLMLMVRFAIPLVTVGSDAIYARFLQQDYAQGQGTISAMTDDLNKDTNAGAVASLDPRPIIERMKQVATTATDHVTRLMVVFLLQTLLVPVFLSWALYTTVGTLLGSRLP